ncbi:MAG: putative addiction module antidote protein [Spirochaetes bacterium]|nr:putative addiction module antidote protein [Spirochaetota bacterium]
MIKTKKFDMLNYLKTEKDVKEYLEVAFEMASKENDLGYVTDAIGNIAKLKGMTEIAKKAGVSRENLYRSFSNKGNPELKTVMKIISSFGLRLSVNYDTTKKAR